MAITFFNILETAAYQNTSREYLIALGLFILIFAVLRIFDYYIIALLKKSAVKTKFTWDDVVVDFFSAIHWQFYAYIAFYAAASYLNLPELFDKAIYYLLLVFIIFYIAQGLSRIVDHFTKKQINKRKESDTLENTSMIKVFGVIFKVGIYAVAVLMILANLGIEITPLIASLGVGGIAIAIALQSVLGDVFSAFAIYFDKPFKEGDFIIFGNNMGNVKQIGLKTTRIQTLQGQELIISNTNLLNSEVNNYKRMEKRRVLFSLGVEYNTSSAKLKKGKKIIEDIIKKTKDTQLDRVHFNQFGDFSLNYEVVYFVLSADYNQYMDIQEKINFDIKEAFEKEKIVFAFPTQTLHIDSFKKK